MKRVEKTIKEAPNYVINEDGVVFNAATRGAVGETKGAVRLIVFGMRKSFKVSDLKEQYFPKGWKKLAAEETAIAETQAAKTPAVEEKPKDKSKEEKSKKEEPKKDKSKTEKKTGGRVLSTETGAGRVRTAYDLNPKKFDIDAFSKETGISKGRIKGAIEQHLARKAKKDAK